MHNHQKDYFDVILMFELLEHLFSPESLLKKCYRILRPAGRMYITLPNKLYPKRAEIIWRSIKSALEHIYTCKSIPEEAKRLPDVNILAVFQLKKRLGMAGFKILKINGWCWDWEDLHQEEKQKLWLDPLKAPDLLITIEKSANTD